MRPLHLLALPLLLFSSPVRGAATPSPTVSTSSSNSDNEGFLTVPGYSSVGADLKKLNVDISKKRNKSEVVAMAENIDQNSTYIYIYRHNTSTSYDQVDLSLNTECDEEGNYSDVFITHPLYTISMSEDGHFLKMLIKNLDIDYTSDIRRYAIREVFDGSDKQNIAAVVPVAAEWLVAKEEDGSFYNRFNNIDSFVVESKEVYFRLFRGLGTIGSTGYNYTQDHFVAFNFDVSFKFDQLVQVGVRYDSYRYFCRSGYKSFEGFETSFNGAKDCVTELEKSEEESNKTVTITPGRTEAQESNLDAFRFKKHIWDNLGLIEDDKEIKKEIRDKYKYVLHLSPSEVSAFDKFYQPFTTAVYSRDLVEISNLTLFNLVYEKNGEIKKCILVDTFSDTTGNGGEVPKTGFWAKIGGAWWNLFTGKVGFMDFVYIGVSIFIFAVGGSLLTLVIVTLKKLYKSITK